MTDSPKDLRRYRFFDHLGGWKLDRYTDGGPSLRGHQSDTDRHERKRRLAAERARRRKPRIASNL